MQKFNQLFLAFLTIATFITCTSTAKQRPEGGWLWKISGNGLSHPSYLFGTYHGTYDILYQYTDSIPELHQAFNACSQFAGESETTSKPTPAQVGAAIKLPKDTTYADLLNKEDFHFGAPFDIETGEFKRNKSGQKDEDYSSITLDFLINSVKNDKTVAVLTAGTPGDFELSKEVREKMGKQYIDVGIAEEHAVAMSSGLAKNGAKPVFCVCSSFIQRTYDQLSQDLCLNNNPALILVYYASVYRANDVTHLGIFDIPMISNIPNLVYLAPTNKEEHLKMMEWGLNQNEHPVAIRVPALDLVSTGEEDKTDYSILNKYKVTKK